MEDLQWADYGDVRVGSRRRTNADVIDVVVTLKTDNKLYRIGFEGPDLVIALMDEGVAIDWEQDSLVSFSSLMEDTVRPIFFALAKLFGMSTDADAAYEKGRLQGENNVLWSFMKMQDPHRGGDVRDRKVGPAMPSTFFPQVYTSGGSAGGRTSISNYMSASSTPKPDLSALTES